MLSHSVRRNLPKLRPVAKFASEPSNERVGAVLKVSGPRMAAVRGGTTRSFPQPFSNFATGPVIELDEMWHYLKKVRAALDLEGLGSCFRAAGGRGMRRS